MTQIVEYVFEEQDIVVKAEFFEEAPLGSQIIWDMLAEPITSEVQHGKWAGPEVYVKIPDPPKAVPPEYLIATPVPGDILYVAVPKSPVRGFPTAFSEFALYYGREGRAQMPQTSLLYGHHHCLVATVLDKENLKKLAQACENVYRRNFQKMTIRRA